MREVYIHGVTSAYLSELCVPVDNVPLRSASTEYNIIHL